MIRIVPAKDYDDMSRKAADVMAAQLILKPNSVIGLATGSTPLGLYARLIEANRQGDVDFSAVTSVNLDEYAGLAPDNDQSYRYFMESNLFSHINIKAENTHVPNGLEPDAEKESARYEAVIQRSGGIDMQLLGLGNNGHIGFNEPGAAFEKATHKVALTESTIEANKRFFEKEEDVPRFAYTMGIGSIMAARRILVIASGENKAAVVRDMLGGPITPALPASVLQLHADVILVADEAARSLL